jgi:hypothetical protein
VRELLENPFGRLENFGIYSTYFVHENQENFFAIYSRTP